MTAEDEEKILRYIMLTQVKGQGPVGQNRMIDQGGSILRCDLPEDNQMRGAAEEILSACHAKGIEVITREDSRYPARFTGVPDAPVLLYAKGSLRINHHNVSVGIIGARRCDRESKEKAIQIAGKMAEVQSAVISGMAKGVDSYAHTSAIFGGAYTIAVLGNGPDICYPREHLPLYEAIAEKGCIISEYPPGTPPDRYRFPMRNRLIAALSDELHIIGAGRNSGTKTTAQYARRYGRVLFYL